MDDKMQEWAERMAIIQEDLGNLYERVEVLRQELKTAGRKTDANALSEPLERFARYGRLFSDIHLAWTEPQE